MLVIVVLVGFVVTAVVTRLSGLWTLGVIAGLCIFPVLIVSWDVVFWLKKRRKAACSQCPRTDSTNETVP